MPTTISDACRVIKCFDVNGDEIAALKPVMIQFGAGRVADLAIVQYRLGDAEGGEVRAEDHTDFPIDTFVQIRSVEDPVGNSVILFEGWILTPVIEFSPDDETVTYAVYGPTHVLDGEKIRGQQVLSPNAPYGSQFIHLRTIFNDRERDIGRGHNHHEESGPPLSQWFGPPCADDGDDEPWCALTAMKYLNEQWGNSAIVDPIAWVTWDADPDLTDTTVFEGVNVQGLGVFSALDRICERAQFRAWIDPIRTVTEALGPPPILPVITLYKANAGTLKSVKLATAGSTITASNCETNRSRIQIDAAQVVNRYIGFGAPLRYEAEFTLIADWDVALEGQAPLNYVKYAENANWLTYQDVYRRFVLNEDGRIAGGTPFDLSTITGWDRFVRRARRFLPCFPLGGREQRVIVRISIDSGVSWEEVPGEVSLLPDCCGIHFGDVFPPGAAQNGIPASAVQVKITAVIEEDMRVYAESPSGADLTAHQATWKTQRIRQQIIDRPGQWHYWQRLASSQQVGRTENGETAAAAVVRDDTQALQDFLDQKLARTEHVNVSCSIRIPWISGAWLPGDRLSKIEGREISLAKNVGESLQYPQVCGLRWRFDEMSTELLIEDFREAEP